LGRQRGGLFRVANSPDAALNAVVEDASSTTAIENLRLDEARAWCDTPLASQVSHLACSRRNMRNLTEIADGGASLVRCSHEPAFWNRRTKLHNAVKGARC